MNLSELMEAPQTVARNLMKPPTTDGRCNYGKLARLFFFFKNGKMHSSDFLNVFVQIYQCILMIYEKAPQIVAHDLMKALTTDGRCNYGKVIHPFFPKIYFSYLLNVFVQNYKYFF